MNRPEGERYILPPKEIIESKVRPAYSRFLSPSGPPQATDKADQAEVQEEEEAAGESEERRGGGGWAMKVLRRLLGLAAIAGIGTAAFAAYDHRDEILDKLGLKDSDSATKKGPDPLVALVEDAEARAADLTAPGGPAPSGTSRGRRGSAGEDFKVYDGIHTLSETR